MYNVSNITEVINNFTPQLVPWGETYMILSSYTSSSATCSYWMLAAFKCSALAPSDDHPAKSKIGGSWTFHQGGLDADRLLRQNTSVARSAMETGSRYVKDLRLRIEFRHGNLTHAATRNLDKVRLKVMIKMIHF